MCNYAWTISEGCNSQATKRNFAYEIDWRRIARSARRRARRHRSDRAHGELRFGRRSVRGKIQREIRLVRAPEPDQRPRNISVQSLEKSGEGAVKVDYNTPGRSAVVRPAECAPARRDRFDSRRSRGGRSRHGERATLWPRCGLPNGPFVLAQVARCAIYPALHRAGRVSQLPDHCARTDHRVRASGRPREEDIARR